MSKPISTLTIPDALAAAGKTGLYFVKSERTSWGIYLEGPIQQGRVSYMFCFGLDGGFSCGLAGMMTPNIHFVIDHLRALGYEL